MPSTPGAPLFACTRRSARVMFSRSTTASISVGSSGREGSFLAVTFGAPCPYVRRFRPLSSEWASGFSAILVCASPVIENQGSCPALHVPAFSPVEGPTMPSADFCRPIPSPLDDGSTWQVGRPPRVRRSHLHAYARRIYVHAFRAGIGL